MDLNKLQIVNGKVQVKRPPTNTLDKYVMASRMIDDDIAEDNNSREVRKALRDDDPRQKKGESVDQWKARLKFNAEMKKYSCAAKGRFKSASGGQYCEDIQKYPDEDLDEYESDFVTDEIEYETDVSSDEEEKKKKLKRKREEVEEAVDIPPDTENTMEDADSESSSDGSSSDSSSESETSEEEEEPKPPRRTMPRKRIIQEPMLEEEEAEPEPEPAARERKRAKVRRQAPSQGDEYVRGSTAYLVNHAGEFVPTVTLENKRVEPDWSKLDRDHFWTMEDKRDPNKLCIFLFSEEGRCWPASLEKMREFEVKHMATEGQIRILKEGNVQPSTQPGYKRLMTHPDVFEMLVKAEKKRLAEQKKKPAASVATTAAASKSKGTAKIATSTTHTEAVDSVLYVLVQTFYKFKPKIVMSAMVNFFFRLERQSGADVMLEYLTFKHKNEDKWQKVWRVLNETKNGAAVCDSFTNVFGESDDVLNLALIHAMLDHKSYNLLSQTQDLIERLRSELDTLRNPKAEATIKQEVSNDIAPATKSEPL